MVARFRKLESGNWGGFVARPVEVGDMLTIERRDGTRQFVWVSRIVSATSSGTIFSFSRGPVPRPAPRLSLEEAQERVEAYYDELDGCPPAEDRLWDLRAMLFAAGAVLGNKHLEAVRSDLLKIVQF